MINILFRKRVATLYAIFLSLAVEESESEDEYDDGMLGASLILPTDFFLTIVTSSFFFSKSADESLYIMAMSAASDCKTGN
jgi:hypothetical protein